MATQFATSNVASAPPGSRPPVTPSGVFGTSTRVATSTFQRQRGLHVSGACDEPTWLALVEAGFTLGDRLLLLGAPQQRGDDVDELQTALNHLGFDCGRPDGIMGPATVRALEDFQRNSGLVVDGVCGAHTVRMLELVSRQSGTGPGVAVVRENESMTAARIIGHPAHRRGSVRWAQLDQPITRSCPA